MYNERYVWSQDFNPECSFDEFDYIVDSKTGELLDYEGSFRVLETLNKQNQEITNLREFNKELIDKICEMKNKM